METELYHYGVKGMKWGVRRQQRRALRQTYRTAKNNAFARYERDVADIEKNYKKGQNLSDKDLRRMEAAEKRHSEAVAKAKSEYKTRKAEQQFARSKLTSTKHPNDVRANMRRVREAQVAGTLAAIGGYTIGKVAAKKLGMGGVGRTVTGVLTGSLGTMAISRLYSDVKYKDGRN